MTRVLLIADTERVQRIFQTMAGQGVLLLQTASTLALGEFELASFSPDFTFVQSRISGFSGDILLRHLDKMLPSGAKLVLLAGDSEDAVQAKRQGRTSLDLSLEDALLEQTIVALLTGGALPVIPLPEAPRSARPAPAKTEAAAPVPAVAGEPVPQERHVPEEAPGAGEEAAPVAVPRVVPLEPAPVQPPVVEEYPPAARLAGKGAASAFEEVMQQAEAKSAPVDVSLLGVEDRVEVGKRGERQEAPGESGRVPAAPTGAGKGAAGCYAGETVADALARAEQKKPRRPYLFIVPVLVLIAVPLASYLAGKSSLPEKQTPAEKPAETAPAPLLPAPAQIAPAPAAPKTVPPVAPPASSKGVPPAAAPAAKGIEKLPAMLEGTRLDAEYGKKHPGWVRYIGLRAEYKLFKENNVYRAIQVIPVAGGTITDDLFRRVLRQFGGVDSYRIESSAQKGDYLVEQCVTPGDAGLTIYRSKNNSKIKALVVYYR